MIRVAEVLVEGRRVAAAVGLDPERLPLLLLSAVGAAGGGGGAWPARRRLTAPSRPRTTRPAGGGCPRSPLGRCGPGRLEEIE